jgi:hypothetical protein
MERSQAKPQACWKELEWKQEYTTTMDKMKNGKRLGKDEGTGHRGWEEGTILEICNEGHMEIIERIQIF